MARTSSNGMSDEEEDWLSVGRSFRAPSANEQAIQVYKAKKKPKESKRRRKRSQSRSDSDEESDASHGKKKKKKKDKKKKHTRRRLQDQPAQNDARDRQLTIQAHPQPEDDASNALFHVDRHGDRENQFYGTLYAQEQPLYRLATTQRLQDGKRVIQSKPSDSTPRPKDVHDDRYFGMEARRMEKRGRTKRLLLAYCEKRLARQREASDGRQQATQELAFIPVDPVIESQQDEAEEDETTIQKTDSEAMEQYLVAQNKLFGERLARNPQDISTWLDLIAFQEVAERLLEKKSTTKTTSTSILEKQQTIMHKALQANPTSAELLQVQLNMQLQSNQTQDYESHQRQIESLLEKDVRNSTLWHKLIACHQTQFATFSMAAMRDLYARIVSVLRKELANELQALASASSSTASSTTSCIQIYGASSLLSTPQPSIYEQIVRPNSAAYDLASKLLQFHALICALERHAGYTERSIAYTQALLFFNIGLPANQVPSDRDNHLKSIEAFGHEWSCEFPRMGEEPAKGSTSLMTNEAFAQVPSSESLENLVQSTMVTSVSTMSPPPSIFMQEHAAFREESRAVDDADEGTERLMDADDQEETLIYSNVHGYRIRVGHANDTSWYERILKELRSTTSAQEREAARQERLQRKEAQEQTKRNKWRDQRLDYSAVDPSDPLVTWLQQEERLQSVQWLPLRSTNASHVPMIEEQPDRAVLTEEIQPFLIRLPDGLQIQLMLQLLEQVGVQCRPVDANAMYQDDFEDHQVLLEPILVAIDPTHTKPPFLSLDERISLLQTSIYHTGLRINRLALVDPSRIQFVRALLDQALAQVIPSSNSAVRQWLRCLWIEFEAQISLVEPNTAESARKRIQALLQADAMENKQSPSVDAMFAYGKMEFLHGQCRQAARVCDKTLMALYAATTTEKLSYHNLVFLRARIELWASNAAIELHRMRCLYVLWHAVHPHGDPLDRITKKLKKQPPASIGNELRRIMTQHDHDFQALIDRYEHDLSMASSPLCRDDPFHRPCAVAYCLHNHWLLLYLTRGLDAATTSSVGYLHHTAQKHHSVECQRWMWHNLLESMQLHAKSRSLPFLAPRTWRSVVFRAVQALPTDPIVLRLFVDAETSNTMSQCLRSYFFHVKKMWRRRFEAPQVVEWLFALLCEISRLERASTCHERHDSTRRSCCLQHKWHENRTGMERLGQLMEEMVDACGHAIVWRLYVRVEVALGRIDAAKKVFYRALAQCPWSKALYLDGLRVLHAYLTPEECHEILELMVAKDMHVRLDP